jgi:sRNA-binding carbon storage regulator CsrA
MLVVSRRLDEGLNLGGRFKVEITGVRRGAVQVTVTAVSDAGRSALRSRSIASGCRVWCREGEALELDADIALTPMMIRRSGTRLGIDAPRSVKVLRLEDVPGAQAVAGRANSEAFA